MAIAGSINKIWAGMLTAQLRAQSVARQLVNTQYRGLIQASGNSVEISTYTGSVTIKDYAVNTDIDAPERPDADQQTLVVDQQKYYNIAIDDILRVQTVPNLFAPHAEEANYQMARVVDAFIRGLFVQTETDQIITVGSESAKLATATMENRATSGESILIGLQDLKRLMVKNGLIREGQDTGLPWLWLHQDIVALIQAYLIDKGSDMQQSQAFRAGYRGTVLGFPVVESNDIDLKSDLYTCWAGTNRAVSFADQITETEPYRMEKQFGSGVKALYVYGGKLVEPDFLYKLNIHADFA